MTWRNLFLPHKETHKKAHLISWEAFLAYVLLFILLQVSFSLVGFAKPGVLGITASIDQKKLIELTNIERQQKGISPVRENDSLNKAAKLKADNMFEENYWAHFAPSGKSPWDFILGSGYKFTYAGENLAKNFYKSDEVVAAWMASPSHRDNLLNAKYQDIGIAVVEGTLNGQKTTLVVQEFGSTQNLAGAPVVDVQGKQIAVVKNDYIKPALVASAVETVAGTVVGTQSNTKTILDPYLVSKTAGLSVISLIMILLVIDFLVLKRRGVFRLSSHHIAHMALLSLAAGSLVLASPGVII